MVRKFKGKNVKRMFDSIDADGNGSIDRKELGALLRKLGLIHMFSRQLLNDVFISIDSNANEELDFQEFMAFLQETDGKMANKTHKAAGDSHLVHMHSYNRRAFA
jgi:Ca2+-binding EF-hand superfamily protein